MAFLRQRAFPDRQKRWVGTLLAPALLKQREGVRARFSIDALNIQHQFSRHAHAGDLASLLAVAIGEKRVENLARGGLLSVALVQHLEQDACLGDRAAVFEMFTHVTHDLPARRG